MAKKIQLEFDIDNKDVKIVSDTVLSLTEQVRFLKKELQKIDESSPQWDAIKNKLNETKDAVDKSNIKSREFFGTLSALPGPIGQFSGALDNGIDTLKTFTSFSFKDIKSSLNGVLGDFNDIAKSIGKATGITKIYTTLNNALSKSFVAVGVGEQAAATGAKAFAGALTATGIGVLVVALGLAVSALMDYANAAEKAAEEQKDLNEAQDRMAKETLDVESQAVKRMGDLDLARAKSKGASADEIYKIEQQSRELLLNSQKRYYESLSSKDGEEGRKTVQLIKNTQNDIKVAEANFQGQQLKDREAANEKIRQKNEQHKQKIAQDNKTADDTALSLTRENAALAEKDERKRQDIELANQKLAEEEKIKALEISQKKKDAILAQINQKYVEKQKDVDAKRKEDDIKAEEDFTKKVAEIKIAAIKDENQRTIADRENKYKNDLADLEKDKEFIKKSEEEKAKIRKDLRTAADNEINKINLEAKLRQQALEKGDDDARVARIMAGAANDLDLQRKTLEEKKLKNDQYYADQLAREGLTADQIRELNDRKLADQIAYTEKSNQIERDRIAVKQKALDDIISIVGAETAVGKAALVAKQILAAKELILEIKKTITFSTQAAARSAVAVAEGTAQTAKVGFPQNIPLLIAYAAQAVGIISAITSAVKSAKSSGSEGASSEASSAPNYGRNYGDGGMIDGPRHAQGGVLINAEGGEAVMTRGAVTMFAPLLSALNQAGGGTSFSSGATGGARPDNPALENPAIAQQPMIMKTYVVSQELTTHAEKEARLKDLSTL